jgi:hypothetical protein
MARPDGKAGWQGRMPRPDAKAGFGRIEGSPKNLTPL